MAYRASRQSPDDLEHFKQEFGSYYGHRLHTHVTQLRQQSRAASQTTQVNKTNTLSLDYPRSYYDSSESTYSQISITNRIVL